MLTKKPLLSWDNAIKYGGYLIIGAIAWNTLVGRVDQQEKALIEQKEINKEIKKSVEDIKETLTNIRLDVTQIKTKQELYENRRNDNH